MTSQWHHDIRTVLWKELTEMVQGMRKPASLIGLFFYLIFFGVFPVLLIGPLFAVSPLVFAYWLILPVMVGTGVATNAFAGERERHTLETLLATRLPDQAILFGKLTASVLYSVIYIVVTMLTGLLTLNVGYGNGQVLGYSPAVAVGGVVLGLLTALVMSAAGVLMSLRASTVREAGQKLALIMLVAFVPYFGSSFVPIEQRAAIVQTITGVNTWLVVLVATLVLLVLAGVLLRLAMQRFQRARLLLDQQPAQPATPTTTARTPRRATPARASSGRSISLPAPLADLLTVMWKEWNELQHSGNRATSVGMLLFGLVFFGMLLPLQTGREWVMGSGALFAWVITPVVLVMRTIADSFAGERERHTLETLLATRLPNAVILLGKLLTPLLWAWGVAQLLMLVSLIGANIAFGQGELLLFSPAVTLAGMGFGLLLGGLLALAGLLLSLRASSVRQAQQTLAIAWVVLIVVYLVLLFVAIFGLQAIGMDIETLLRSGTLTPLVLSAAGVLALLDAGLLALALYRFRRARLLLV
jgi:ABC-2 type transport system permease protein